MPHHHRAGRTRLLVALAAPAALAAAALPSGASAAAKPAGPPAAPVITQSTGPTGQIGSTVTVTFSPAAGCGAAAAACPARYTYQADAGAPVTVRPNNTPAAGDWTGSVPLTHLTDQFLTVYGQAGGQAGPVATAILTVGSPATPYQDGHWNGGKFPSLVLTGTGPDPSAWLWPGTGNGKVGTPIDIGALGDELNPGADGPGDFAGAVLAHGNFFADNAQDILAYSPRLGSGVVIPGNGGDDTLDSFSFNASVDVGQLADPTFANPSDNPVSLVGAGNASEQCNGIDDLIGVLGDPASGFELDLFTDIFGVPGPWGFDQVLSAVAPDGTKDWQDYTLATAQPADSGDQTGCALPPGVNPSVSDPDAVVLFALNTTTGALYESVNPNVNSDQATDPATATPVGSGNWTRLSDPWGSAAPDLVSADVNAAGSTELWTMAGGHPVSYTLSGTTVSKEHVNRVTEPAHDWPFASLDTITGQVATFHGTQSIGPGPSLQQQVAAPFGNPVVFDGSTNYEAPPTGTISGGAPDLSLWFRSTGTTPGGSDGVLVSLQADPLSSGPTTTGGLDPVLYIGTDGHLRALWGDASPASAITSKKIVSDGLWHHAVLSVRNGQEILTVDGRRQGSAPAPADLAAELAALPSADFGAGFLGGPWPDEASQGSAGTLSFFAGNLADITFSG